MSVEHLVGKGYAPLPQSISNTDTEDEDEHCNDPSSIMHKQYVDTGSTAESTLVHENGVFYPLDETRNLSNRTRNGQNLLRHCADDIPIMVIDGDTHNDLWKRRDMSPLRRFCLVVSILLCIATILIFLYVLPCDNSAICPPVNDPKSAVSWDKTFEGIELHGPISVVAGSPYNLIFLLRGEHYGEVNPNSIGQRQIPSNGGGVLSIHGKDGIPLWWISLKRLPTEIDCVSLDTTGSGKPDCLVAGEHGLLNSIDPTAGIIHWSSEQHTYSKLPIIIPDVNFDDIDDLLSIELQDTTPITFVLLSGKTGFILGQFKPNCSSIDIENVQGTSLSFDCHHVDGTSTTTTLSIKEIIDYCSKVPTEHRVGRLNVNENSTGRFFQTSMYKPIQSSLKLTPLYSLNVLNEGICPGKLCVSRINVTLRKSANESRVIWSQFGPNSFAMQPVAITTTDKPYITGFAVKSWQWMDEGPRDNKLSELEVRKVMETVTIVFINHTDVRAINASQTETVQLCKGDDCQPRLELQTRSLATADLDENGIWELISYQSTYNTEESKVLTSKVEIVKLDSIVSKLSHSVA